MSENNNRDRYGRAHKGEGDHQIGDSMPGTIGDSEGILHEKLGDLPSTEEDVKVFEPGQREREEERSVETDEGDVSIDALVERL